MNEQEYRKYIQYLLDNGLQRVPWLAFKALDAMINAGGEITTKRLNKFIIKLKKHPKFYANIIAPQPTPTGEYDLSKSAKEWAKYAGSRNKGNEPVTYSISPKEILDEWKKYGFDGNSIEDLEKYQPYIDQRNYLLNPDTWTTPEGRELLKVIADNSGNSYNPIRNYLSGVEDYYNALPETMPTYTPGSGSAETINAWKEGIPSEENQNQGSLSGISLLPGAEVQYHPLENVNNGPKDYMMDTNPSYTWIDANGINRRYDPLNDNYFYNEDGTKKSLNEVRDVISQVNEGANKNRIAAYLNNGFNDHKGGILHNPLALKMKDPNKYDAYWYKTPDGWNFYKSKEDLMQAYPSAVTTDGLANGAENFANNYYFQDSPVAEKEKTTEQKRYKIREKPTWMRSMPIFGSGIAFLDSLLEKPDYRNVREISRVIGENYRPVDIPYDTIGNYRRTNPYDENYAVNLANAQNAMGLNAAMNSSGGNRGLQQAAALQSGYNRQLNMANIAREAMKANRDDEEKVAEFNRGTNQTNANWANNALQTQAATNASIRTQRAEKMIENVKLRQALKDQLNQARMNNFTNFMNNIQNYGRENLAWNQFAWQGNNGYFGEYGKSYFDDILQGIGKYFDDNGYKIVKA